MRNRRRSPHRCPLFAAIVAGMAMPAIALADGLPAASSQEASAAASAETTESGTAKAKTLDKVEVTGSRIKRAETEGPTPVVVITAEDIKKQGFSTITEVMRTLPSNNGEMVAGELNSGATQQPDAQFINLRGLGVGYQLILINGKRTADYATSSTPDATGVSLGSIPAAAVERIEVLNNGASAIYGSDAVAGVVNIVTKENWEGNHIRLRGGTTSDGGGDTGQFQWVGGKAWDRGSVTYAFEQLNREPIRAGQRTNVIPSGWNSPGNKDPGHPTYAQVTSSYLYGYNLDTDADEEYWLGSNGQLIGSAEDTDAAALRNTCALAGAVPIYPSAAAKLPTYCGSMNYYDGNILSNQYKKTSGYVSGNYKLTDKLEAYGQFLGMKSRSISANRSSLFIYGEGYDPDFGYIWYQRAVDPDAIGGVPKRVWEENMVSANVGLRGTVFDRFDWDASLSYARDEVKSSWRQLTRDKVEEFLFGGSSGTLNFWGYDYPIYDIDPARLFNTITAEKYNEMTRPIHNRNVSQASQTQFVFSGPLFALPAGDVEMAAVLEAAHTKLQLGPDYRSTATYEGADHTFNYTATSGGGARDRYGAGLEFRIPIFRQLTADIAGRWDKYDDISSIGSAMTWQAALEWRPIKSLLVRGSHQTSFMAPNIMWIYGDPVRQYGTFTNEYLCRVDGLDLTNTADVTSCYSGSHDDHFWYTSGGDSTALHEETATSNGIGVVWDVFDGLSLSADWWSVELKGKSQYLSAGQILSGNADCLLGRTSNGQAVDSSSAGCAAYAGYVTRDADGNLTDLTIGAVNQAGVRTSGFDASLKYSWKSDVLGNFTANMGMSKTLKYEVKEVAGDPWVDYMGCSYGQSACRYSQPVAFRTRTNLTLAWNKGDWSANVYGWRNGTRVNYSGAGRLPAFTVWNGGVSKAITDKMRLGLDVTNIFNKYGPKDSTITWYPFYQTIYGITGRAMYVNLDIDF